MARPASETPAKAPRHHNSSGDLAGPATKTRPPALGLRGYALTRGESARSQIARERKVYMSHEVYVAGCLLVSLALVVLARILSTE